jgi:hypothetical protein
LGSVVTYSISLATFMCQWMPLATPRRWLPPPTCTINRVTDSVLFSSLPNSRTTSTLSPWNFSGQ